MSAYRRRPLLLVLAILMFPVPGYAQGEDPTEVFQEELVLADRPGSPIGSFMPRGTGPLPLRVPVPE